MAGSLNFGRITDHGVVCTALSAPCDANAKETIATNAPTSVNRELHKDASSLRHKGLCAYHVRKTGKAAAQLVEESSIVPSVQLLLFGPKPRFLKHNAMAQFPYPDPEKEEKIHRGLPNLPIFFSQDSSNVVNFLHGASAPKDDGNPKCVEQLLSLRGNVDKLLSRIWSEARGHIKGLPPAVHDALEELRSFVIGQATPFEQFRVPPQINQTLRYVSASDAFNSRAVHFGPAHNANVMNLQSYENIRGVPNPVYQQAKPPMPNIAVTMDMNNPMTNQDNGEFRDLWSKHFQIFDFKFLF